MQKKGISLIVLVITIIVMIILAATVVITLSNTGIIDKANQAVKLTDEKQIQQIAELAWGEAYANGARTKAELQLAVDEALLDIDTSQFKVEVTEKGVVVSANNELELSIFWNSMDVIENTSVTYDGMTFVKVSDKLPTLQEIEKAIFKITANGTTAILPYYSTQDIEGNLIVMYDEYIFCIANVAGEISELGITIPEEGFYSLDFGTMGIDGELEIYICKHTNTAIKYATTATCVKNGYTGDVVCECGTVVKKGNSILANQNHTWNEYNLCSACKSVKDTTGERTTLSAITWSGYNRIQGFNVWTDGTNTYYSHADSGTYYDYVLKNGKWESKTWNIDIESGGSYIWTDGTNTYYSGPAGKRDRTYHYVLNGDTWEEKTWNGYTDFIGRYIWSDGTNIYCVANNNHYVLNGDTWEPKTWNGYTKFTASYIWSDGTNIYYSYGNEQYVLNGNTWEQKTWNGLTSFYASDIWKDGKNVYFSDETIGNYVLNGDTWEPKTWNGCNTIRADCVWNAGTSYYYSEVFYKFSSGELYFDSCINYAIHN